MNWLLSEVNLVANLSLCDVTDLLQLPHPVLGCHGMPSPSGSTWMVGEGGKWGREREREEEREGGGGGGGGGGGTGKKGENDQRHQIGFLKCTL